MAAIQNVDAMLKDSIRQVRTVSFQLHPPLLDEAGLETALGYYLDEYALRHGAQVDLDVSPELGRPPPAVEIGLFRLVEQALDLVRRQTLTHCSRVQIAPVTPSGKQQVSLAVEAIAEQTGQTIDKEASFLQKVITFGRSETSEVTELSERAAHIGAQIELDVSTDRSVVRVRARL